MPHSPGNSSASQSSSSRAVEDLSRLPQVNFSLHRAPSMFSWVNFRPTWQIAYWVQAATVVCKVGLLGCTWQVHPFSNSLNRAYLERREEEHTSQDYVLLQFEDMLQRANSWRSSNSWLVPMFHFSWRKFGPVFWAEVFVYYATLAYQLWSQVE